MQFAIIVAAQHIKIERLKQHVTELGVADAGFPILHASAHTFFGNHLVDREMFADLAQKIEISQRLSPRDIIQQPCRIGLRAEVEEFLELRFNPRHIGCQHFSREQLPLLRFAARIANRAGGPAGEGNGMMAQQLKPAKCKQRNHAADVQAVGCGIEATIERDRSLDKPFGQGFRIGAISQQSSPLKFFQNRHRRKSRRARPDFNPKRQKRLPHSKSFAIFEVAGGRASVLECGCPFISLWIL